MELKQLWAVIVRRWWLILLPAAVALILTLPSLRDIISPASTFTVTIRFSASQVPTSDRVKDFQDESYIPWLASEYVVTNLATWMKTESFAREIADRLQSSGKTFDVNALRGAINSDSVRSIMTLYLTWPNPDELKGIAQAAIDVLQNKNQTYFPQFGTQQARITPMDSISVAPIAAALATRLSPLVRIVLGLLIGVALAFLVEYLDPTLRSRREIEALGFSVIGEIPREGSGL